LATLDTTLDGRREVDVTIDAHGGAHGARAVDAEDDFALLVEVGRTLLLVRGNGGRLDDKLGDFLGGLLALLHVHLVLGVAELANPHETAAPRGGSELAGMVEQGIAAGARDAIARDDLLGLLGELRHGHMENVGVGHGALDGSRLALL